MSIDTTWQKWNGQAMTIYEHFMAANGILDKRRNSGVKEREIKNNSRDEERKTTLWMKKKRMRKVNNKEREKEGFLVYPLNH